MLPLAGATALVAYLQLAVGAQLRHMPATAEPGAFRTAVLLHLLLAAVVLLHAVWLVFASRKWKCQRWLSRPGQWLLALVAVQVGLGATTWLFKYGPPSWLRQTLGEWDFVVPAASPLQSLVVTGHVATGSLIVAVALLWALRLGRATYWNGEARLLPHGAVEAAL
jgi:cytochrome c oxidase assembly protein subunit 15